LHSILDYTRLLRYYIIAVIIFFFCDGKKFIRKLVLFFTGFLANKNWNFVRIGVLYMSMEFGFKVG